MFTYQTPNLCAWCGKNEVVTKKKASAIVFRAVGGFETRILEIELPICSQDKKAQSWGRTVEAFVAHGNHVEFLNRDFHQAFASLNPSVAVIALQEDMRLPNLCAWCGTEPPVTMSVEARKKLRLPLPICDKCLKAGENKKEALVGAYLAGRPYFHNPVFFAEFKRLNPAIAYDRERAITDGVYEQDFKNTYGFFLDIEFTMMKRLNPK